MLQPLLALIALLVGVVVYNVYVQYLNYDLARALAEQKAREKSLSFDRVIVEAIERGDVNYVQLGIFNRGTRNAEIKINADRIGDDLSTGMVLWS
jgi:hypothetical protein